MQRLLVFILLCISLNGFSERLVIKGKPAELILHSDYYTLPENYIAQPFYHHIRLAGLDRICYLHDMPTLKALPKLSIIIEENNDRFLWTCYRYSPLYFEIDY